MAFWGVEIKPGKPFTLSPDTSCGRLRISQATLGLGSSNNKSSSVQCNVGNKTPVLLCSLLPDKAESIHLELEFQEAEEVTLSVIGPRSIHLTGYFLGKSRHLLTGDDESESFGEDIGDADTEVSNEFSDSDEYEGSFIDDGEPSYFSSSPSSSEEAIKRKKKSGKRNGNRKRIKKKYVLSGSEDDGIASLKNAKQIVESDQDDQKPISSLRGNAKMDSDTIKRKVDDVTGLAADDSRSDDRKVKRKKRDDVALKTIDHTQSEKRGVKKEEVEDAAVKATDDNQAGNKKVEKKQDDVAVNTTDDTQTGNKKVKTKKQHKLKNKPHENLEKPSNLERPVGDSVLGDGGTRTNIGTRTTSDGLVIEELEIGEQDGKVAISGKKVTVHYTGRLKEGGKEFDSSVGKKPLKFRLGKDGIDGLNLGIEGMRVGGRRRLIIPPKLGYDSEGTDRVPPNAWLIMDVELLHVRG